MRAYLFSAAFVAALAATAMTPDRASAQIVYSPAVPVVPYGGYYPNYYTGYYPSYWSGYQYSNPYFSGWGSQWASPYGYGTIGWSNVSPNYYVSPYFTSRPYGFMSWPNYVYRR